MRNTFKICIYLMLLEEFFNLANIFFCAASVSIKTILKIVVVVIKPNYFQMEEEYNMRFFSIGMYIYAE